MDWDMLRKVVEVLKASNVSEIAVEYGDTKIQVRREGSRYASSGPGPDEPVTEMLETEELTCPPPTSVLVKAGRVGILHLRDQPDGKPLVEEGQEVLEGQTIAYVESVKLMTEVLAPQTATVAKILGDDGAAVEYGQPLFELQPSLAESVEEEEE